MSNAKELRTQKRCGRGRDRHFRVTGPPRGEKKEKKPVPVEGCQMGRVRKV